MPTQTVTFGAVTAHPVLGGYAVVVGGGNQWSDDSDATYAEMDSFRSSGPPSSATAPQAVTPSAMTSPEVTLTARISGPVGSLHTINPTFLLLNAAQVAADPSGNGLPLGAEVDGGIPLAYTADPGSGGIETDADGLAHTYTVSLPYTTDPYGDGVWADFPERITAGGLYMAVHVGFGGSDVDVLRVYEVSLTLTTVDAPAPLRLYPRNNATRIYPRRRTRRPGTF